MKLTLTPSLYTRSTFTFGNSISSTDPESDPQKIIYVELGTAEQMTNEAKKEAKSEEVQYEGTGTNPANGKPAAIFTVPE